MLCELLYCPVIVSCYMKKENRETVTCKYSLRNYEPISFLVPEQCGLCIELFWNKFCHFSARDIIYFPSISQCQFFSWNDQDICIFESLEFMSIGLKNIMVSFSARSLINCASGFYLLWL